MRTMADLTPTPSNPEPVLLQENEPENDESLPEARPSTPPPTIHLTVSTAVSTEPTEPVATEPTEATDPKITNGEPTRPAISRNRSSETMIVPRDHPLLSSPNGAYRFKGPPPMSPPRPSDETEELGMKARIAIEERAKSLQSGLTAIAEKIESVKSDHEKLEKQNTALQEYISSATRNVSSSSLGSGKGKK